MEERGILITPFSRKEGFSILPLTLDFLSTKWHENRSFRDTVAKRWYSLLDTDNLDIFKQPYEEIINTLYNKANDYERKGENQKVLDILQLSFQWSINGKTNEALVAKLRFLEGKIRYKLGERGTGINLMKSVIENNREKIELNGDDYIYLSEAIFLSGRIDEQELGMNLFISHMAASSIITK